MLKGLQTIKWEDFCNNFQIKNHVHLFLYLSEISKELSKNINISRFIFYEYIGKLPMFLSNRVFSIFDTNNINTITDIEFQDGIFKLCTGTFEELCKFIFMLCDFNSDDFVELNDIKLILFYFSKSFNCIINDEEHLKEIDSFLQPFFVLKNLSFTKFQELTTKYNSDLFFILIIFLYKSLPFTSQSLELLQYKASKLGITEFNKKSLSDYTLIKPSPLIFMYFKNINEQLKRFLDRLEIIKDTGETSDNISQVLKNQIVTLKLLKFENDFLIENSNKSIATSNNTSNSDYSIYNFEETKFTFKNYNVNCFFDSIKQDIKLFTYENVVYKYDKIKNKMRKVYILIIGKEMYYFKNSLKTKLKGVHYINNYNPINTKNIYLDIKILPRKKLINDELFYTFTLFLNGRERNFYVKSIEEISEWLDTFRTILNVKNILSEYEFVDEIYSKEKIKIKIALNKQSKEYVAVKIFSKQDTLTIDGRPLEHLIEEVDILKIINHKNVVKYVDFFEDPNNFYLITEYLEAGNLFNLLLKNKKVDEYAKEYIILQICDGLNYLHSIGVMHRDLKPCNIAMKNNMTVKIIDFGLSTIVGDYEFEMKPCGTLLFSAPEVVLGQKYNKEIDIWSLGVTLLYIYFGRIPFYNDKEVHLAFNENFQDIVQLNLPHTTRNSKLLHALILQCLVKNFKLRYNMHDVFNHPYLEVIRYQYCLDD